MLFLPSIYPALRSSFYYNFCSQALCGFLSFAVYFSVLAEFCWLLLHGLRIHGRIKKLFASNLNIEIVYFGIGWGMSI